MMNFKIALMVLVMSGAVGWGESASNAGGLPGPIGPSSADLDRLDREAVEALSSARSATDRYVRAAEDAVNQQLGQDPNYRRVRDDLEDAQRAWAHAHAEGRLHETHEIEADIARLKEHEQHLRVDAFSGSSIYQRAKSLQAQLVAVAAAQPEVDPRAREIGEAIANHRLAYGMSFDEAVRAVGPNPFRGENHRNVVHYRWDILAEVDLAHRDPFRRHDELAVVGHWHATFTEGRISEFRRERE